jgi:hypothetical protein
MSYNDDDTNSEYNDDNIQTTPTPTPVPKLSTNVYISIVVASVIIASPFVIYNLFFKSSTPPLDNSLISIETPLSVTSPLSSDNDDLKNKFNILQDSLSNIESKMTDVNNKISKLSEKSVQPAQSIEPVKEESSIFNLFGNATPKVQEESVKLESIVPEDSIKEQDIATVSTITEEPVKEQKVDELVIEKQIEPIEPIEKEVVPNKNPEASLYSLFGMNEPNTTSIPSITENEVPKITPQSGPMDFLNSINPFSSKKEEPKVEENLVETPIEETPIEESPIEESTQSQGPILSSNEFVKSVQNIENPFNDKKGGKTKHRKNKNKQKTKKLV